MDQEPAKSPRGRFGISREQWLSAALDLLEVGGVEAVRVQKLATIVGVNRSGFYWHFEDRAALLNAILEYWADLEQRPLEELDRDPLDNPVDALKQIAEVIEREDLARLDAAIRQWAKTDTTVAAVYREKMRRRLEFARGLFSSLGFDGLEREMRSRTFVGFFSMEREFFRDQTPSERAELTDLRISLLCQRP